MNDENTYGTPRPDPYGTPPPNPYGPPPLNPYGAPQQNPYYAPYVKPTRTPYAFVPADAAYACFALALGFLCWEFGLFSNLGAFVIIAAALTGSSVYLRARGIRQTRRSIAVLVVCVAGALPFLLYDAIPGYLYLTAFVLFACFYWIAVSAGNSVEARASGFILTDWLNQTFSVPFSNYLGLFLSIKTASKDTKRGKSVLIGVIGLCIAIPLIIGVTTLLINSDAGFEKFANDFSKWIGMDDIGMYLLKFIGGIPIACYIFGAVCGNVQKRYAKGVTKEGTERALAAAHRIPRVAILTPLAVLCILYIVYIAVMSVYLFSALSGSLPDEWFIYAEYARRGFFELCGVAAINLFILAFTYSFAKRMPGEYPGAMRFLTGLLCVMTELLIATGVSKMLLYIDAYGLSRLRVYTLWFLILLFVVFAVLTIWHIKPFNAGRPVVVLSVGLSIALFLANTDALIAKYNVWQYQSGKIRTAAVDTDMLAEMSDAVLPYLSELKDNAKSFAVSLAAREAIYRIEERHMYGSGMLPDPKDGFRDWSIQSSLMKQYLPENQAAAYDEDSVTIGGVQYSKSLTELDLSSRHLTSEEIVPLEEMTNLTVLYLHNNFFINDLSPLSGLTNLTCLSLQYNGIRDLTPLSGLTKLTRLSLGNNDIVDIAPLSGLVCLNDLYLNNNRIEDLTPLAGLANLTSLDLSRNQISDLTPLSGLTRLTWLSLARNHISDLAPLAGLAYLNDLSLSDNRISDFSPLSGLVNLIWLDVDRNQIEDLSPLSGFASLYYINLEHNNIGDWSPAKSIRNIQGSP